MRNTCPKPQRLQQWLNEFRSHEHEALRNDQQGRQNQRVQNGEPAPTSRRPRLVPKVASTGIRLLRRARRPTTRHPGKPFTRAVRSVSGIADLAKRVRIAAGVRARAKIGRRALADPCRRATVTRENFTAKRPISSRASQKLGRRIKVEAAIASRSAYYYNEGGEKEGKGEPSSGVCAVSTRKDGGT